MSQDLNHTARDSMVSQITDAMDVLREKKQNIDTAMDYYEQARNNSYTAPMDEVKCILNIVSKRLDMDIEPDLTKAKNLAGVADDIHKYEKQDQD